MQQTSVHVWVKLDSSKSDGQSRVCEISGDTRESLRVHRQTESALRVAKALNSNTQDVTQDGVHAEVRQGTG